MKRILSLLLALCLIVGLLPSVAIPHAHAAVTSANVTLFGVSTTIDLDETTTDIPEARYWVNGEVTAKPVEVTMHLQLLTIFLPLLCGMLFISIPRLFYMVSMTAS